MLRDAMEEQIWKAGRDVRQKEEICLFDLVNVKTRLTMPNVLNQVL